MKSWTQVFSFQRKKLATSVFPLVWSGWRFRVRSRSGSAKVELVDNPMLALVSWNVQLLITCFHCLRRTPKSWNKKNKAKNLNENSTFLRITVHGVALIVVHLKGHKSSARDLSNIWISCLMRNAFCGRSAQISLLPRDLFLSIKSTSFDEAFFENRTWINKLEYWNLDAM